MKMQFGTAVIGAEEGFRLGEFNGMPILQYSAHGQTLTITFDEPDMAMQLASLHGFIATTLQIQKSARPAASPALTLIGLDGKPKATAEP